MVVTRSDIEPRFESDLDAFPREYVDALIEDAVAMLETRLPGIGARVDQGTLQKGVYLRVIANMIGRVLRNPGGYTSESEANYSYGMNALVASGTLWLSDSDIAALGGTASFGFGTVGMGVDRGWGL